MVHLHVPQLAQAQARRRGAADKIVPGAEVMTQHGIYGTLVSIDEEKNEAIIETTPGTGSGCTVRTLSRVVDPVETDDDAIHDEAATSPRSRPGRRARPPRASRSTASGITEDKPKRAPRKKADRVTVTLGCRPSRAASALSGAPLTVKESRTAPWQRDRRRSARPGGP